MASSQEQKSDKAFAAATRQMGIAFMKLERAMAQDMVDGARVTRITIRGPEEGKPGYLATIKGRHPDGSMLVAFKGGDTAGGLMLAIADGIDKGTMRWREDEPWTPEMARDAAGRGKTQKR